MRTVYDIKDVLDAIRALSIQVDQLGADMAKTFGEVLTDVEAVKAKVVENTDQTVELFTQAGTIIEGQSALIAGLKATVDELSKRVATDAEQAKFADDMAALNADDARIDKAKADFAAKLTANPSA
jgi:hypothetical protein